MGSKKQSHAVRELEQKLAGNPKSRAFSRLAELYREGGDLQGAVELCRAGLAEHPGYVTGRLVLARCYKEQGNLTAAADESIKVCSADIRNPVALRMLADIYLAQGRAAKAGSLYAILSEMEPDNAELRGCAAKNKERERGTAAEILGIKPAPAAAPPPGMTPPGMTPPPQKAAAADSLESQIESQLDSLFSDSKMQAASAAPAVPPANLDAAFVQPPPPPPAAAPQPSGEDVAGQLDSIFGEIAESLPSMPAAPPPPPMPAAQEPEPMPMIPMPPPMPAPPAAASAAPGPDVGVSGDDVAGHLDALFGGLEAEFSAAPSALPPAPPAESGQIPSDEISGDDVAGHLDALFGGAEAEMLAEGVTVSPTGQSVPAAVQQPAPAFGPAPAAVPAMPAEDDDQLSGDDLVGKLNELFGESEPLPPDAPAAYDGDQEGRPSGDDVAGHLDALFGGASSDEPVTAGASAFTGEPVMTAPPVIAGASALTDEPAPPVQPAAEDVSAPADEQAAAAYSTGNAVVDQFDQLFGGQAVITPGDVPAAPIDFNPMDATESGASGGGDQLDELFGGQAVISADEIPDSASIDISSMASGASGGGDQLDQLFGGQSILSADAIPGAPVEISPMAASGNAVVDQLDELFGGQTILPPAAVPEDAESFAAAPEEQELAELPQEPGAESMEISGGDIENRLETMFGGDGTEAEASQTAEIDESAPLIPTDVTSEIDEAAIAAALEAESASLIPTDITSEIDEAAIAAALEPEQASGTVSGDDVKDRLDAMYGEGAEPSQLTEADGSALTVALEPEQASGAVSGDDIKDRLDAMYGDGAAASSRNIGLPDEQALVVDGADGAPPEDAAPPEEAGTAGKLPVSIVLDENGEDVARTPTAEDIEERIDTIFGGSGPKDPLVVDEEEARAEAVKTAEPEKAAMAAKPAPAAAGVPPFPLTGGEAAGIIDGAEVTGDDVKTRLAEMFGSSASDTTAQMAVEDVMAVNLDDVGPDQPPEAGGNNIVDAADGAIDTDGVIDIDNIAAEGVINAGDVIDTDNAAEGAVDTDGVIDIDSIAAAADAIYNESAFGTDGVAGADGIADPGVPAGADGGVEVIDMDSLVSSISKPPAAEAAAEDDAPPVDMSGIAGADSDVSVQDVVNASNSLDANAAVDVIDMDSFMGIGKDTDPGAPEDMLGIGDVTMTDEDNAGADSAAVADAAIDTDGIAGIDGAAGIDTAGMVDADGVINIDGFTGTNGIINIDDIPVADGIVSIAHAVDAPPAVDIGETAGSDNAVNTDGVVNLDETGIAGDDGVIDISGFETLPPPEPAEPAASAPLSGLPPDINTAGVINFDETGIADDDGVIDISDFETLPPLEPDETAAELSQSGLTSGINTIGIVNADGVIDIDTVGTVGGDGVINIDDVVNADGVIDTDTAVPVNTGDIDVSAFNDDDDSDYIDIVSAIEAINASADDMLGTGDVINMRDMDDEIRAAMRAAAAASAAASAAHKFMDMDDEIRAEMRAAADKIAPKTPSGPDPAPVPLPAVPVQAAPAPVPAAQAPVPVQTVPAPEPEQEPVVSGDDVEERIRQLFLTEGPDPDPPLGSGIDSGADSVDSAVPGGSAASAPSTGGVEIVGPDERDTPFDLPDHVLTSTLADIYYQQGQPQLALHIYERLLLRDPGDVRLSAKIEEIRGVLQQLGEGGTVAPVAAVRPEKAPSASSGRKKKADDAGTPRADVRPLAGVRIKKGAPAKKGKRAKPKP